MADTTKPEPGTRQADLWLAGWETGFQAGLADEEPVLPATAEGQWKDGWLQGNLDAGWERLAQDVGRWRDRPKPETARPRSPVGEPGGPLSQDGGRWDTNLNLGHRPCQQAGAQPTRRDRQ